MLLLKRLLIFLGVFSAVIMVAFMVLFENFAPYLILKPVRQTLPVITEKSDLNFDTLSIKTQENITLRGYFVKPQSNNFQSIMMMVHGIGGCKESFMPIAENFAKNGIATIIYDQRAHGESGGDYCTFGYYEKKDISIIIDSIKAKYAYKTLGIWGNSLGGAVALQAMSEDKRINFGIVESSFATLEQVVYDYMPHRLKIQNKWLANRALAKAAAIGNFEAAKVSPLAAAKYIEQPIFVAHGDKDELINVAYGRQIFANLSAQNKTLTIVEGAGHHNVGNVGGEAYQKKLWDFILSQTKK
jgi:uncharacterized protein